MKNTNKRKNGIITKEYIAWKAMKSRCYSPSNKDNNYQKRGIIVCDRWKHSFENFYNDMGKAPSKLHSLDRINNDGNYEPGNCRWVVSKIQSSNRSNFNKIFTLNGESMTLKDWSRKLNIKYNTLWLRIYRSNLSFEEAIKNDPYDKLIYYKNEYKTLKSWCEYLKLPFQTIIDRKRQGWSVERMFEEKIKIKI